jgi:HEAT repeat protein/MFS family permease
MAAEVTTAEKIRRLPWNIALSATNNVFATFTFFGSAFVLFLNMMGVTTSQIGFLLSLLPFSGIVAIFIAPKVAQFGYKRTFVLFFGIRKLVTAFLLLVPAVWARFGEQGVLVLVTVIVAGFALCRAISETALFPWAQEYIPNSVRGKHSAINDMVARVTGLIAIAVAGYVLEISTGIDGFMFLFVVGIGFGVASVWSSSHLPGGAPTQAQETSHRDYLEVLKDRNFTLYMVALAFVIFGSAPLAFLPIFMQDHIGLTDSSIVLLQMGPVIGGFTAVYLFGWAADRYGSKPVMQIGLAMKTLLPVAWLLMPRQSTTSLAVAMGIAFIWGIAEIGWAIGSGRLLFVRVVPYEKRAEYMAVYYALVGVLGGISQIVSGRLLDAFEGISGQFLVVTLDNFTPMFVGGLVLTAISLYLFSRVQADSTVSVGAFAGMFVHGNPLLAFESLIGYYRARDERATVVSTERMGVTKSRLTVDELLEALTDPRFNVRFEAIISIARMGPEPRLVKALTGILDGTELSLSVISAWALGRMGDDEALPALRNGMNSSYRSIQAHCVRSLGTLGDQESVPVFLSRIQTETDKGLRIAYASALGNLHVREAVPYLLRLLEEIENEGARMELALSLARILGGEQPFIRVLRGLRNDRATTASQVLAAWKRKAGKGFDDELLSLIDQCANDFASGQIDQGALLLSQIIHRLPEKPDDDSVAAQILAACAARLAEHKSAHFEYVLLTFFTLQTLS